MTLDELNSVIMQQNRLLASAATIDELKDMMVRMDIIRG